MPSYEYRCSGCKKKFTLNLTMKEHDKKRVKCPKCRSNKVEQLISTFMTKTSRKS